MENNISNSDKTDEVHIEEYDKTGSFETGDADSKDPDDLLSEDKTLAGVEEKKSKKSISVLIEEQLPALANIFKRKKKKEAEALNNKKVATETTEANAEDKPKPKFKLTPIHIIVIIGLFIFLFIGDEEPEPTAKPLKPIKKEFPVEKVEEPQVAIEEPEIQEPAETVDEMADIRMENTPERVADEKPLDQIEEPAIETPESDPPTTVMDDIELDIDKQPRVEEVPTELPVEDEEVAVEIDEPEAVVEEDPLPEPEPEPEVTVAPEEIVPQEIIDPEMSTDMTKKLLENLQVKLKEERVVQKDTEPLRPMSAPSYVAAGSGLVYNCKGGHWACIEADEFKKCRQNYAWNKSESIPIECYPFAFLDNDYDCETVQQEKVNSVPDLNFCE